VRSQTLFDSFLMAGFECSTQLRRDGRRLDLLAATSHDRLAVEDYRRVGRLGLRTVRDGLRWHLIEPGAPGHYDWTSFVPMLRAAEQARVQVIWDLLHYGWPDGLPFWEPVFVDRFAKFAASVASLVRDESDAVPVYSVVNEISFWAWAGNTRKFHPLGRGKGDAIKRQLVRATIAAIEAIRSVDARARFVQVDPLINVVGGGYNELQFAAWDMLAGALEPGLGGSPHYLDIVGVNYYPDNQWFLKGSTIPLGHACYRPFREMLADVAQRYLRPVLVAETGAEGSARTAWLFYVAGEVRAAIEAGVPVEGICLYPIIDYPGWEDDRPCDVGLMGVADPQGQRSVYQPLAEEIQRQQLLFAPKERSRPTLRAVAGRAG
jgi:hypothetical protein